MTDTRRTRSNESPILATVHSTTTASSSNATTSRTALALRDLHIPVLYSASNHKCSGREGNDVDRSAGHCILNTRDDSDLANPLVNECRDYPETPDQATSTMSTNIFDNAKDGQAKTVAKGISKAATTAMHNTEHARALEAFGLRGAPLTLGGTLPDATVDHNGTTRSRKLRGATSRIDRALLNHFDNMPPHPDSVVKSKGTPAMDRSVSALTRFKNRKRQGSLLQMMLQSDVEDAYCDSNIDESMSMLEFSPDDSTPDHESTPLIIKRKTPVDVIQPSLKSATSRARRKRPMEQTEVQISPSSRAFIYGHRDMKGPQSSHHLHPKASNMPSMMADMNLEFSPDGQKAIDKDVVVDMYSKAVSPPSSTVAAESFSIELGSEGSPDVLPSHYSRVPTPRKGTQWSVLHTSIDNDTVNILSSSELESNLNSRTLATNLTSGEKANPGCQALSISTDTLRSLLPRRRKSQDARRAEPMVTSAKFDISSSPEVGSEVSEEEASHDIVPRFAAARDVPTKASGNVAQPRGQYENIQNGTITASPKGPDHKSSGMTYGRNQPIFDAEQSDADALVYTRRRGTSDVVDVQCTISKARERSNTIELDLAFRKFKKVDQWNMDFENVETCDLNLGGLWR